MTKQRFEIGDTESSIVLESGEVIERIDVYQIGEVSHLSLGRYDRLYKTYDGRYIWEAAVLDETGGRPSPGFYSALLIPENAALMMREAWDAAGREQPKLEHAEEYLKRVRIHKKAAKT